MQLTLSTPPFAKPPVAPQLAHRAGRPRDEAVLSQLDQIAEQNLQASRHGLGASAMFLALIGGLVILGSASMWSTGDEPPRKPVAAVTEARPAPAVAVAAAAPTPVIAAAPQAVTPVAPTVQAPPEPVLAAVAAAEPMPAADDAARKARVAKAAEAKRKAAQLAQERALAEETQRLQLALQREGERAQQLAEQTRQRAAAEQAHLAAMQLASDSRRSVGDVCSAAGGFISQQFCQARECRKAEHLGDGICVTLRETEAARLRASAER
jgi:hypothetical protein